MDRIGVKAREHNHRPEDTHKQWTSIRRTSKDFQLWSNSNIRVHRTQIPLLPATATKVHKPQGETIREAYILTANMISVDKDALVEDARLRQDAMLQLTKLPTQLTSNSLNRGHLNVGTYLPPAVLYLSVAHAEDL